MKDISKRFGLMSHLPGRSIERYKVKLTPIITGNAILSNTIQVNPIVEAFHAASGWESSSVTTF